MRDNEQDSKKLSVLLQSISVYSVRCANIYIYGGGLRIPHGPRAQFHYVLSGSAMIENAVGTLLFELRPGDFVLFPRSLAHTVLVSSGGSLIESPLFRDSEGDEEEVATTPEINIGNGKGDPSVILAGTFRQEHLLRHPLFAALPSIVHLRRQDLTEGSRYFVDLETTELRRRIHGADHVDLVRRFVDLKVAQIVYAGAVRHELVPVGISSEWRVTAAKRLIERSPERAWTVSSLAREVGMSRSAFSESFTHNTGATVMSYLRSVRMRGALELIQATSLSIGAIAPAVGFDSVVSFTRAFKRFFGASPVAYRKSTQERKSHSPVAGSCVPLKANQGEPPRSRCETIGSESWT